jgi:type IV pilus assembly protein PilQ
MGLSSKAAFFPLLAASLLAGTIAPPAAAQTGSYVPVTDQTTTGNKIKLIANPTLITLNLENTDVRTILETMAKKGGLSVIIDDSVTGTVRVSLKAIPLDEALYTILKLKSLSYRKMGQTLLIASEDSFRKKGFSGNSTALLRFDNAKAEEVETIFKQMLTAGAPGGAPGAGGAPGGGAAGGGAPDLAGPRIVVDKRTNAILVTASEEVLDQAKQLKALLDIQTPQVSIEVKMIEVSENGSRQLGLTYGFGGSKFGAGFNNPDPNATAGGQGNQAGNPGTNDTAITFQALGNYTANFNARLNAMIQDSLATVIANPKVTTQDSKKATIKIVNKHPVLSTTVQPNGPAQTSVSFEDVGQTLDITPRVDTQGYVTLELAPEISARSGGVTVNGNEVPIIDSRSVSTTMRVKDGESIIIGGLSRVDESNVVNKFPVLGDIPLIGNFFRHTTTRKIKNEIIMLVTPKVQSKFSSSIDNLPTLNQGSGSMPDAPGANFPQGSDGPPAF